MNVNVYVDFNSVTDVLNELNTIKTNIDTCFNEKVSLTSLEGSKKEELESCINKRLVKTGRMINEIMDSIIDDTKRISGMYEDAYLENSTSVDSI